LLTRLDSFGPVPLQNYFYRNKGDMTFEDLSVQTGITEKTISNGAAYADLDNDGDLDLVINNIDTKASILQNELNSISKKNPDKHFITLELKGDPLNRQGIGTKVNFYTAKGNQFFEQFPVRGFLSSVDQRIHIGFGKQQADSIVITWPDDRQQTIVHPPVDTILLIKQSGANKKINKSTDSVSTLFTDITSQLHLPYRHNESFFYDYGIQSLLPQKFSQEGPFISAGDLNADGLEDFFVGGAYKQSGKIFLQLPDGKYKAKDLEKGENNEEDMQSILFDADGDKDPDLLIASGSSQFHPNSPSNKSKLFINDGKGNFAKDNTAIPGNIIAQAKCIAGADFDGDGDTDVFIGGRVIIATYPQSPRSFLLRNDEGKFTDITPAALQFPGLLNAATWADIDNDKIPELVLAGEWMPVRIFKNVASSIIEITGSCGIAEYNGYWRSITASDMDDDGDIDLVAGNLGLNNPYRISKQQPAKLVARDFDGNGVIEPVFCYYIPDENFVYKENIGISRDQWAMQMPSIKKKFDLNQLYASASMDQIITENEMKDAIVLTCNEVRSGYFENNGKGNFIFHPFDFLAQVAPVNTILVTDVDKDGKKDVLIAGNEYEYKVAARRMDASYGLMLKGNGKGEFKTIMPVNSGWISDGNVRDLKLVDNKRWGRLMLAAINNDSLHLYRIK